MEFIDEDGVVLTREDYRAGMGKGRVRQRLVGFEPSVVDQSKAAEADLNVLVRRWMNGEPVPEYAPGVFADVTTFKSYQEVADGVVRMETMFLQLPAHLRERFGHSASVWADAMVDPDRQDEMVSLGLLKLPEAESPAPVAEPAKPASAAVPEAKPPEDKPA